jgi:hypothetical protein
MKKTQSLLEYTLMLIIKYYGVYELMVIFTMVLVYLLKLKIT